MPLDVLRTPSATQGPGIEVLPPPSPDFGSGLLSLADFLAPADFLALKHAVDSTVKGIERSFIPTHKKGGTVAFDTLARHAPTLVAFYRSRALRERVSALVGVSVAPLPAHDQNSLSILVYDRPGDHIGWHYDHNFYRGRHFTLLLPIVNVGAAQDGLSQARLLARLSGVDTPISTAPNQAVLFEGARVLHRVTPIAPGERRVILSMTLCSDARAGRLQVLARRVKDIAFFGPRALWA